ncbi:lysozyme inhibitor LprI family protein [Ramlibacter alkalitolerans]|uniref:Uncharacterized protein n=2 Tax=Ramlibacter alkalitolerans TaxID=2039631 RepID=A0ABS1JKF7_9BURK|nr:hypothetical protein [Ramlibacter alkalitolerans]
MRAADAVSAALSGRGHCEFAPLLASSGGADRQFSIANAVLPERGADPGSYLTVAREAQQQNRLRDAEVALIVACRLAARQPERPNVVLGDVEKMLADHYAEVANTAGGAAPRGELLARATTLMHGALETYRAALGEHSSKTQLAQQRLASLDTSSMAAAALLAATRTDPEPVPQRRLAHSAPPKAAATTLRVTRAAPARGSLLDERIPAAPAVREDVRADAELAQLERDLQRLRAQVAAVSDDPDGLRRRSAQAVAQRERCRDKACLLRWYAARRGQLLDEF